MIEASLGLNPKNDASNIVNAVKYCRSLHVVGMGKLFRPNTGCKELGVRKWANRLHAVAQVLPELVDIASPRKTPRHAHDCNCRSSSWCSFLILRGTAALGAIRASQRDGISCKVRCESAHGMKLEEVYQRDLAV